MVHPRPRFVGAGATLAAIAAVIALGFMERRSIRDIRESAGWVRHTPFRYSANSNWRAACWWTPKPDSAVTCSR